MSASGKITVTFSSEDDEETFYKIRCSGVSLHQTLGAAIAMLRGVRERACSCPACEPNRSFLDTVSTLYDALTDVPLRH